MSATLTADQVRDYASAILSESATTFAHIQRLACGAEQESGDSEVASSLLAAIDALAGIGGVLADRASRALDGDPGVQGLDAWIMSPRAAGALRKLRGDAEDAGR